MSESRAKRVQQLFLAATEVPEASREAWLADECGADRELFTEVWSLLAHAAPSVDLLEQNLEEALSLPLVDSDGCDTDPQATSDKDIGQIGSGNEPTHTHEGAVNAGRHVPEPAATAGDRIEYFGDYEIVEELARGGMGVVYKARQVSLNRTVALKMILSGHWAGEEQVQRFRSEAEAAAKLDHPGIVPIHEIGKHEGRHYFSMGFIEGQNLAGKCKDGPLSPKESAEIMAKVGEAVAYAHGQGVIHRDLKPANVLLDSNGDPKVTDFGLAKQVESDSDLTRTGAVLGTPSYMPPEQAAGKLDEVGPRSDVYALGAVFYFLLTGRPPFQASTIPDTLRQVFDSEPFSIRKLNPSAPRDLETICLKALAKDATHRYEDCSSFAADIKRWLANEPIRARRVGKIERVWIWSKRRPLVAALAMLILVLIAVGCITVWERQNAAYANGLVVALLKADTNEANGIIQSIDDYRYWASDALNAAFDAPKTDDNAKLHAAMALVDENPKARDYLFDALLELPPAQLSEVGKTIDVHVSDSQLDAYRTIINENQSDSRRFRAACALATFASDDALWTQIDVSSFVANYLVHQSPSEFLQWTAILRPVGKKLRPALGGLYRDSRIEQQARSFAADALGEYLGDEPEQLFNLLLEAELNTQLFKTILDRLGPHSERVIALGNSVIGAAPPKSADEEALETYALRRANAAAMLLQLGAPENVWPLLADSPDPRLRSYLIHTLCRRNDDVDAIAEHFRSETDPAIKQALLLCIGSCEVNDRQKTSLLELLRDAFVNEADAGIHGAAEWVLRKWQRDGDLSDVSAELQMREPQLKAESGRRREWYINSQGQTFTLVDAGEFSMGSPDSEPGRRDEEALHRRKIERRIAISSKEVTMEQWRKFYNDTQVWSPDNPQIARPSAEAPMIAMSWFEAAHYCNWLSEQEGISEDQWCYQKNSDQQYGPGMKAKDRFWELSGYRLPTEGEWEFACRAGSTTCRSFGESDRLMRYYAWYRSNSQQYPELVGRLKPNRLGLFDMHGNVYEWCNDRDLVIDPMLPPTYIVGDWPQTPRVVPTQKHVIRGGAFSFASISIRSADRYQHYPVDRTNTMGFRPVRSYPY